MRDYGKVHTSFWSSANIRALSEDGRTLAIYLLTCPHGTIAGVFRLPDGYASEDLQWDSARVREGFEELFRNGFANRCETTKWVFVRKHLEWNPPENPNQRKAAQKIAKQIPNECAWKPDFMRVCGELLGLDEEEPLNGSETLEKPFPNQEQEQEQDKEEANASVGSVPPSGPQPTPAACPADAIVALYHELLPDNPRCKVLSDARRSAIRARWKEAARLTCKPFGYSNRADGLAAWRKFFEICAESDFLTGRAAPLPGRPAFVADIDFLMSPSGFAKTLENKYHREVGEAA